MSDKHSKDLQETIVKLHEKREDLFSNVDTLVNTASQQVQSIQVHPSSLSDKEALYTYLTKILVLFTELNHSSLKFLETVVPPIAVEAITVNLTKKEISSLEQDFKVDHDAKLNQSVASFDSANNQAQHNLYISATLNVVSNDSNNALHLNTDPVALQHAHLSNMTNNSDQKIVIPAICTDSIVQPRGNLSCSESDIFSSSSTFCPHPLTKFHPPSEIPSDYDTSDLEQVKENMKYFSRKMGFDPEGFIQMTSQYDKGNANCQFEEPVKEVLVRTPIENETAQICESTYTETNPEKPQKLNNETLIINPINNQEIEGPSQSTGAIKKEKIIEEDLIQFSGSTSDTESCDKVSSWLERNSQIEEQALVCSTDSKVENCGAIEKLSKLKRYDRNEEVREKARADMPDLRLVPVKPPLVIKNDLKSNGNSLEASSKAKTKVKDLNKDFAVYEIPSWNVPLVGTVCVFSHIISPGEFYLQVLNDVDGSYLDVVAEQMDDKFSKTLCRFRTKQEASARLGRFCCGYIWGERKAWYRLQVLDWKLDNLSDDVEVQSVDYGFKCFIPYIYLRDLTADLVHIPMLAVKCHFLMLYPPGSTYSNRLTRWPLEATEALYDIANLNRDQSPEVSDDITMFEIMFAMQDGDSMGVDLVEYSKPDSIAQFLADTGLATEIFDDYGENPELGEFLEDNDELEDAENINEFLLGYDAKDEARICRFTRKDGSCYKGKHCKLEHIQVKDGYTTDKAAVFYAAINDLIFPNKGDTVQILVTAYVDSCTYLVQMIRNPVKKENANFIMDKDISDLMDAMNHPKIIAKYNTFKILPGIGEMVLAFHPVAKKWMRTAVRELNKYGEDRTIEVYSVDFGEEFLVNTKNIAVMQEEFMHVPFQVIQIYLDNYQHKKDCDHKVARKFFSKHLAYKNFLAHIKSNDLPFKVSLMTFKHREIGPTLVRERIAEPRTMDIFVTDDLDKRRNFDVE